MAEKIVTIEKVVFGGKGLSRDLEKVAFIPYTLPGEKVRMKIRRERRDYIEAEATEIIEPNVERVPPDCPYFGSCGGCQISHASYRKQLEMKEGVLRETLQRNRVEFPSIEIISDKPFGYRHRARLKFDAKRRKLGFFQAGSNQVVDIHNCICLTEGLNRLLHSLRSYLLTAPVPRLTEIVCFENESGGTAAYFDAHLPPEMRRQLEKETLIGDRHESIAFNIRFRNCELPMHPDYFLQVNPGLWNALVQEVESHHSNANNCTAVELYCGAGFFTVPLSKKFSKIYAVEENEAAIRFARDTHATGNVEWISQKAERFKFPADSTVLIADPPRTGLHRDVVNRALSHGFHSITYVSCDCTSFARDLKLLGERYRLAKLTLVDLFPQTFHFETVALLTSK